MSWGNVGQIQEVEIDGGHHAGIRTQSELQTLNIYINRYIVQTRTVRSKVVFHIEEDITNFNILMTDIDIC